MLFLTSWMVNLPTSWQSGASFYAHCDNQIRDRYTDHGVPCTRTIGIDLLATPVQEVTIATCAVVFPFQMPHCIHDDFTITMPTELRE